jgi:hypothetical protein
VQRNTVIRPFDAYGKLAIGRDITRTIQPQISGDVALGFRSSNVSVDIFTPEVPNAMERIKQRNKEKKNEAVKQKRKMENYLEVAKEQVLASYKIKSVL